MSVKPTCHAQAHNGAAETQGQVQPHPRHRALRAVIGPLPVSSGGASGACAPADASLVRQSAPLTPPSVYRGTGLLPQAALSHFPGPANSHTGEISVPEPRNGRRDKREAGEYAGVAFVLSRSPSHALQAPIAIGQEKRGSFSLHSGPPAQNNSITNEIPNEVTALKLGSRNQSGFSASFLWPRKGKFSSLGKIFKPWKWRKKKSSEKFKETSEDVLLAASLVQRFLQRGAARRPASPGEGPRAGPLAPERGRAPAR
ncbi:hypothetical protein JZ751_021413 [Albula glossodonta]|uniref:Phosphatase and actin regulator 4 n=1 Tax=Albula glossodonta TaxID=121402 RepID=A0A8T2MZU8_9TELE|nr:hypothetical protein JZ751_021413 [Albula glossodonta]